MKVLVTGANGFVGSSLCVLLRTQGHEVLPVVREAHGLAQECVLGCVDEATDWRDVLSGCDAVVHLAALTHVMRTRKSVTLDQYRAVNVGLTLTLARQAALAGVQRFIFLSSIKVNGEATLPEQAFTELDKPAPLDAYGRSKLEAEQGLFAIAQETGIEIVIIRPPLVYGPGVKGNFAALVFSVRKGVPLPLGAVRNRRSLVALDNLVDFVALCVDRERSPTAANGVFLISDGHDVCTVELLRQVAQAYNVKARLLPVPQRWLRTVARWVGKKEQVDRLLGSLVVDSSRARRQLGWHSVITMDEQLRKMADHDAAV